jgi:hypothetical protein|tara:strand:+ start:254 stop:469 length:216 start_codon:yes stop_codon:yes gene_type:complete
MSVKGINGLKHKKEAEFILQITRTATIREETTFVVDMYEGKELIESRKLSGYSKAYAESCAENWENGVIEK